MEKKKKTVFVFPSRNTKHDAEHKGDEDISVRYGLNQS